LNVAKWSAALDKSPRTASSNVPPGDAPPNPVLIGSTCWVPRPKPWGIHTLYRRRSDIQCTSSLRAARGSICGASSRSLVSQQKPVSRAMGPATVTRPEPRPLNGEWTLALARKGDGKVRWHKALSSYVHAIGPKPRINCATPPPPSAPPRTGWCAGPCRSCRPS
jgi:hypothetical protein